jgi:hypothetical protein
MNCLEADVTSTVAADGSVESRTRFALSGLAGAAACGPIGQPPEMTRSGGEADAPPILTPSGWPGNAAAAGGALRLPAGSLWNTGQAGCSATGGRGSATSDVTIEIDEKPR